MCESKSEIGAIVEAGLFPCEPFYADMAEGRKEEVLDEFRTGQIGVLIGVVVGIKHGYRVVWEEWQRQMVRRRANVEQVEEMTRVLGSEAAGQEGGSELVHAFVWLTERVEEIR